MPISDADLLAQAPPGRGRVAVDRGVERAVKLRADAAVGGRIPRTNLRNVIGDGGHGIGIWQQDQSRLDVARQRRVVPRAPAPPSRGRRGAAAGLRGKLGAWPAAVAAYNAGEGAVQQGPRGRRVDPDSRTTGGDYAADVESRRVRLLTMTGHPAAPATTTRSAMPATMLSRHFSTAEFACRHCGDLPPGGVSGALLAALEVARERHYPGG